MINDIQPNSEPSAGGSSKPTVIGSGGKVNKPYRYKALKVFGRRVDEHRYVMELHLGRYLKTTEVVRHHNDNPKDNRLENLYITDRQGQVIEQMAERKFHNAESTAEGRKKAAKTVKDKFGKKVWICDRNGIELMLVESVAVVVKILKAKKGHVANVLRKYKGSKTVKGYTLKFKDW